MSMKSKSKYFLGLTILFSVLFLFCCFSIIYSWINLSNIDESEVSGNILSIVYLFIHLLVLSAGIYFAFKSYFYKDSLLSIFMTLENGQKNEKAFKKALILSISFGLVGIYFFLNAFKIISVMSFLSLALNVAITNVCFTVSFVSLYIYFYKPKKIKEVDVKPIE